MTQFSGQPGEKRRVLVLGAGGFIGRRIVARLKSSAWAQVTAASRGAVPTSPDRDITWLRLDATDEAALRTALVGIAAVVNCVAGDSQTIINGSRALFTAASKSPSRPRVVHFSSLAAYGSVEGNIDEASPLRGDLGDYSAAKMVSEQLASTYESTVIFRPGIVYGPGSDWWSERIAKLLCARRLGDLGAAGMGYCNLVFVDDVADATLRALQASGIEGRAFNLGSPQVPTWNEYFMLYAEALRALPVRGISRLRLAVEVNCIAPALKLVELAARLPPLRRFEPPPPIRPWLTTLCRHRIALSVRRAEADLGMRWTDLDAGLATTADWYHARSSG